MSLGVLDSEALAIDYVKRVIRSMRRAGVFPKYRRAARKHGEGPATHGLIQSWLQQKMISLSHWRLPYTVYAKYAPQRFISANTAPYLLAGKVRIIVEVGIPPLPVTSEEDFYRTLSDKLMVQLVHEIQHVPQQIFEQARTGEVSTRQYTKLPKPRGAAATRTYWRTYLTDPFERPAFAAQIKRELRDAGLERLGFPASKEAKRGSFIVRTMYKHFDPNDPADARVLKDYAIAVARVP